MTMRYMYIYMNDAALVHQSSSFRDIVAFSYDKTSPLSLRR